MPLTWFRRSVRRTPRPVDKKRGRCRTRLHCEVLERRELLTAGYTPDQATLAWMATEIEAVASGTLPAERFANEWIVTVREFVDAAVVSQQVGAVNLGPTGFIDRAYLWQFPAEVPAATAAERLAFERDRMARLEYFYPMVRYQLHPFFIPDDPLFPNQWHLLNTGQTGGTPGADANVTSVWDTYQGAGVRIAIIDSGIQHNHPDLLPNRWVNPGEIAGNGIDDDGNGYVDDIYGWDFNANDNDPLPNPGSSEFHGTSVAGVAAARGNNALGVSGAAPQAQIISQRLLGDLFVGDLQIARAIGYYPQVVDINNNSYGYFTYFQLSPLLPLTQAAFQQNATLGRGGLGTIMVFAAGNDGDIGGNTNYTQLQGSRFVITVAAIDHNGRQSVYSTPGATVFVSASSDNTGAPGITTTDVVGADGYSSTDYTNDFGGTSSASPLVAGVIALMLEANPNLTYRDVQHILAASSRHIDPDDEGWAFNGAGYHVSHKYGFGAIDAAAAVSFAQSWVNVPPEQSFSTPTFSPNLAIPDNDPTGVTTTALVTQNLRLEWVEVEVNITHTWRGDLRIVLTSPYGTRSVLAEPHIDDSGDNYIWKFSTNHHWGELSAGIWRLDVSDEFGLDVGTLNTWKLNFYGTTPAATGSGRLFGTLFEDLNRSGAREGDEPGLFGRTVFLDANNNGVLDPGEQKTTTDADGNYNFANLTQGFYRVRQLLPAGWIATSPLPNAVFLMDGQSKSGGDFGSVRSPSIIGRVFNDRIGNGVPDANDPPLTNWTVYLDLNNNGQIDASIVTVTSTDVPKVIVDSVQSQITVTDDRPIADLDVTLNITHTWDADLVIHLVGPTGKRVRLINQVGGSGDNFTGTILDDEAAQSINQGSPPFTGRFRPDRPLSAFDDLPANGTWTLEIVDVFPFADDGVLLNWSLTFTFLEPNIRTDSNGEFAFLSPTPGQYVIRQVLPPSWLQVTPDLPVINYQAGQFVEGLFFGNFQRYSLSGVVFQDSDGDGQRSPDEPGLAGWEVFLDANLNGVPDPDELVQTTSFSGAYTFTDLGPGIAHVRLVLQPTYLQTTLDPNRQGRSGRNVGSVNFGVAQPATVRGRTFEDRNSDGFSVPSEPSLEGITVYLDANNNGQLDTATGSFQVISTEALAIPDAGTLSSTLTVAQTSPLSRVVVRLDIAHERADNLDVFLVSPRGTRVELFSDVGGTGQNFLGTVLDDAGFLRINSGTAPFTGTFQPEGLLSQLLNEDPSGTWTLEITDDTPGNVGTLLGWSLEYTVAAETAVQTNAAGQFSFAGLRPGTHRVRALPPPEHVQTTPAPVTAVLLTNQTLTGVDVGFFRLGRIQGMVFDDLDGNGQLDPGESGVAGRIVFLDTDGNGSLSDGEVQLVTGPGGTYAFTGLSPGSYRVRQAVPAGNVTTAPPPPEVVLDVSGATITGINLGTFTLITLGGVAFDDLDGDGLQDPGELPVPGLVVTLDRGADGSVDGTITTDGTGRYSFPDLGPGTYRLRLQSPLPAGLVQTTVNPADHAARSGVSNNAFNFGTFQLITVSGTLFDDLDGDGLQGPGEGPAANLTVELDRNGDGTAEATTTTDPNGNFTFIEVGPGSYVVRPQSASGLVLTGAGSAGFQARSGQPVTGLQFGTFRLITVSGQVFDDRNSNGSRDPDEPGLVGRTIELDRNADGSVDFTTTTDANGNFTISNVGPGTYRIRQQLAGSAIQTTLNPPDFTAQSGQNVSGLRFGAFVFATVSGIAFDDRDGNGAFNVGDVPLSGRVVELDLGANGSVDFITTTDATGNWSFIGLLAGIYRVRLAGVGGEIQTTANPADLLLSSASSVTGVSFGTFRLFTLSGRVFDDGDGNGVAEAGDQGVADQIVTVDRGGDGTIDFTVTTGPDGTFAVPNLGPGIYRVRLQVPGGVLQTTVNPADLAGRSGTDVGSIDFGTFTLAAITGRFFADVNANGRADAGEAGVGGVTVFLDGNDNGQPDPGEPTTQTAADGSYLFTGLQPGTYRVRTVTPAAFVATTAPRDVTVRSGATVPGGDFGAFPLGAVAGFVFQDTDGNGRRDPGEPGLAGVNVFLDTNANGIRDPGEQLVETDGNGAYTFVALNPGTFLVRVQSRPGSIQTTANPGGGTVPGGATAAGGDFGFFQLFNLGGRVFVDRNGNGTAEAGETGESGLIVFLDTNGNGLLDTGETTAQTNGDGRFTFSNLPPGVYRPRLALPLGRLQTTAAPADVTGQSGVDVTAIAFGTFTPVAITGRVFEDLNDDGRRDPEDPPLPEIRVFLDRNGNSRADAGEPQTVTNGDGIFMFTNVGPGTYSVGVLPEGNFRPRPGSVAPFTVTSGTNVAGLEFPQFRPISLSGLVYNDQAGNGVRDPNDPGFPGVQVFADANDNGFPDTGEVVAITDAGGSYRLEGLGAGSYRVRLISAPGRIQTTPLLGQVVGQSGASVTDLNLGVYQLIIVAGRVFLDADGDGSATGEASLPGMSIALFRDANGTGALDVGDTLVATTVSGTDGHYRFGNVGPGRYLVAEFNRGGRRQTAPDGAGVYVITAQSGQDVTGLDFGNLAGRNETFVFNTYVDLLGRRPDPAGMAAWVALLNAGVSRTQVVQGFQSSPEYLTRRINEEYFRFLGRAADPVGLQAFLQLLSNTPLYLGSSGLSGITQLRLLLATSDEFFARHGGTHTGYVQGLYRTILGREADTVGLAAFGPSLSRGLIVRSILESDEATNGLVQALYAKYLHRTADSVGLAGFGAALRSGVPEDAVIQALASSDEYYLRDG